MNAKALKHLKYTGSVLALMIGCLGASASGAMAQTAAAAAAEDEGLVVTGTSFRGVAPVGSNLVSVGRQAIDDTGAQTIQQILKTVPQITAAGNAGQGPAGTSYYAPTIHSLGSSASNSTLVLIDSHRFSLGGSPHPLSDPNIVPPIALERVEVLAEGASSIYGSDAVAGVINFITRKNYDGFMVTAQGGFADGYSTKNAGVLWGTVWDQGSAMVAYAHSDRSALKRSDRPELLADHTSQGGTNFKSFNCAPATIQPGGAGNIFLSATATTSIANTTPNSPCDNTIYGDLLPRETRDNVMAKLSQELGDKLTVGLDFVFSNRDNHSESSRGTLTATAFGATTSSVGATQVNPFYINPPGVTAANQTIRWSADDLLGPGAYSNNSSRNYYVSTNAEYDLGSEWTLKGLALMGRENHTTDSNFGVNGSAANLALNGTTNTTGSAAQASIPGTNILILQPLTAANALDVWNPSATNRTSAEVKKALADNLAVATTLHGIDQARVALDGPLFALPGGPIRVAVGAEYLRYMAKITRSRSNNTGPASRGSEQLKLNLGRNVKSAFVEVLAPFVSADNAVPLIRNLNITVSGRYDDYSDVGSTFNPKIGGNWEVFDGLRLRGNWSQSFVAPAISSLGDASRAGLATFSGYGNNGGAIIIPLASYPLARQIATCNAPGQVTCTISNAAIPGISYNNGNPNLKPQTGEGWSAGFDIAPPQISGLKLALTVFNASFRGGVTSPNLATVINTPGLNNLLTFYPAGATAAEIKAIVGEAPLNGPLPSPIYFIRNGQQQNVVNLDIQGVDANVNYEVATDTMGTFTAGAAVSRFTKFDQNIGGGPWFSVLNTTGFNETFPSIETQARFNVGWEAGWFSADLFANYIGAYRNWSTTTVAPLTRDANGNPNGGGDPVDSSTLLDLHVSADLPKVIGQNAQVYVDVTNLTDKEPTFYNSSTGYDGYGANPIGRVISVGARLRF